MIWRGLSIFTVASVVAVAAIATAPPQLHDWWVYTQFLASDALQGREAGSSGYRKAAQYVADQFKNAGLKPAGEARSFFQSVPLHSVTLVKDQSLVELVGGGAATGIALLEKISITPRADLPAKLEAAMIFAGYGVPENAADTENWKGKFVVYLNALPLGSTKSASDRARSLASAGAIGGIAIDNPRALEVRTWPVAYDKTVSIAGNAQMGRSSFVAMRLNPEAVDQFFAGTGHTLLEIEELQSQNKPLPSFDLPAKLKLTAKVESADFTSDNILAVLPGSDPALARETIVVSAHLDGYGLGEAVNGDGIYNGAFDDAAYVSTLIGLANHLKAAGKAPRRSILFAVFTAEEKGLLGSSYFVAHPTIPKAELAADINLDMLRPIFPLTTLTVLALNDSTLGSLVSTVAKQFNVAVQPDLEPERGLFRRADHYSFIRIGVPAVGFVFGYAPNSNPEKVYRNWYAKRYHRPADDIEQPIDFQAAFKFNEFFERLTNAVANADSRPTWAPDSQYAQTAKSRL